MNDKILSPPSHLVYPLVGRIKPSANIPLHLFNKSVVSLKKLNNSVAQWSEKTTPLLFNPLDEDSRNTSDGQQTYPMWKCSLKANAQYKRVAKSNKNRQICITLCDAVEHFPSSVLTRSYEGKSYVLKDILIEFCQIFFFPIKFRLIDLPHSTWKGVSMRNFPNKEYRSQILVTDVFTRLEDNVSSESLGLVALSWTDLYPDENSKFVFGQASHQQRQNILNLQRNI